MKSIEASRAIILKTRTLRELQPQVSEAGFAFIENWPAEKRVTFDVQYDFRQALCCREKLVRLKARDSRQRIKGIRFRQCDDVVRNRVDTKFPLVKILHNILITQLCQISDAVDIIGKIRPIQQAEPVTPSRNVLSWHGRLILVRILVLDVVSFELGPAVLVLAIFDAGIKANGHATQAPIIEPNPALDIVGDRERDLGENRRSPRAQIGWCDRKAKRVIERLIQVRPPKNRHLPDIQRDVSKNHAVFIIYANRSRLQMKIGLDRKSVV